MLEVYFVGELHFQRVLNTLYLCFSAYFWMIIASFCPAHSENSVFCGKDLLQYLVGLLFGILFLFLFDCLNNNVFIHFLFFSFRDRNLYKLGLKGFYVKYEDDCIGKICLVRSSVELKLRILFFELTFQITVKPLYVDHPKD